MQFLAFQLALLLAQVAAWRTSFIARIGSAGQQQASIGRRASVHSCDSQMSLDDEQWAAQAVAWYDELAMLEVVCMGDIQHYGADAGAIERAIAESGGNVSRYLPYDERSLPDGSDPALAALEVSFCFGL